MQPWEKDELIEIARRAHDRMIGRRVECVRMTGDPRPVPAGVQGTVVFVDDIGTIHVKWDNGSTLGLIPGLDSYKLLSEL